MISRNRFIETELVEQRTLLVVLMPHHRPSPTKKCRQKTESLFAKAFKSLLQQNVPVASFFRAAPNTAPLFVQLAGKRERRPRRRRAGCCNSAIRREFQSTSTCLIHIIVLIIRESSGEGHIRKRLLRRSKIPAIKNTVFLLRYRIVRV